MPSAERASLNRSLAFSWVLFCESNPCISPVGRGFGFTGPVQRRTQSESRLLLSHHLITGLTPSVPPTGIGFKGYVVTLRTRLVTLLLTPPPPSAGFYLFPSLHSLSTNVTTSKHSLASVPPLLSCTSVPESLWASGLCSSDSYFSLHSCTPPFPHICLFLFFPCTVRLDNLTIPIKSSWCQAGLD